MKINGRTVLTAAGFAGLVIGVVLLGGALGVAIGLLGNGGDDGIALPPSAPAPTVRPSLPISEEIDMEGLGDCAACHETPDGGIGTRPVPPLAHPREGWNDCTGCHAPNKLVNTAPGHTGIHKDQCTVCHTKYSDPAPDRPHPAELQLDCLSCHGTTRAHLPETMEGWQETTCWLCHRSSQNTSPQVPHTLQLNVACRSCHTAGRTGELPDSHATRTDDTCTACHLVDPNAAPVAPHDLASREGQCAFCHDPGSKRSPGATLPLPSSTANP
jgi:hypothetical protein